LAGPLKLEQAVSSSAATADIKGETERFMGSDLTTEPWAKRIARPKKKPG
jgi:hypothetical protein